MVRSKSTCVNPALFKIITSIHNLHLFGEYPEKRGIWVIMHSNSAIASFLAPAFSIEKLTSPDMKMFFLSL